MNWRYLIGSTVNRVAQAALSSRILPLSRYVPRGRYWLYDVQRFAGSRELDIVFDVGANIGQTAYDLIRYLPNAHIFCVEPVHLTMQKLKEKYARYSNIEFVQAAFGSRRETVSLPLHRDSELNSLVRRQPRMDDLTGQCETISVDTIDNFCRTRGIGCIDLLKLDVQGWELEVLRGAEAMIEHNAVHLVYAEVTFKKSDTDMQYFSELHDYMACNRFNFCGLYDVYRYGPAKQFVGFSNALYINSAFAKGRTANPTS